MYIEQLLDCQYFTTKLFNDISRNIGYKIDYFKTKSMLDEQNYYIRITLKGKSSMLLKVVISATCWRILQLNVLKSRQPGRSRIKEKELVIHMDALFLW